MREIKSEILENGLQVIWHEDQTLKHACVGMVGFCGSRDDPKGKEGLHHAAEHMALRGTQNYPSTLDLTEPVERFSGQIGAFTSLATLAYYCNLPKKFFQLALTLCKETVFHPLHRDADWQEEREVILKEHRQMLNDPRKCFNSALLQNCFAGTGLDHRPIGNEDTIRGITIGDIRSCHFRNFSANNCALILTGSLPDNFIELVRDMFSLLEFYEGIDFRTSQDVVASEPNQWKLVHPAFSQAQIQTGQFKEAVLPSDWSTLSLFAEMLGVGTLSSPLFQLLRVKLQLFYSGNAFTERLVPGITSAAFGCSTDFGKVEQVIDEYWRIVAATKEDYNRFLFAKDRVFSSVESEECGAFSRFLEIVNRESYGDYMDQAEVLHIISTTTFEQVREMADRFFDREKSYRLVAYKQ